MEDNVKITLDEDSCFSLILDENIGLIVRFI